MSQDTSKEFEIAREFEVDATPEQVWDAVTSGTGGWLWPMEAPEPREGGRGPFGSTVTAWDPPHRYTNRVEDVEGISEQTLNQLDYTIEPRDEGRRAWVRYVHSGIFVDDWDNQYDAAGRHTDFYLHTLRQYLTRFDGVAGGVHHVRRARRVGEDEDALTGGRVGVRLRVLDPEASGGAVGAHAGDDSGHVRDLLAGVRRGAGGALDVVDAHRVRVRGRGDDDGGRRGADGGDGERGEARGRPARQRVPSGDVHERRDEGEAWDADGRAEKNSEHLSPQLLRASISCLVTPVVKVSAMYDS
ncbi:hypothetical protein SAURM35S_07886 [Streptomyces aurantiogriseus]